MKSPNEQDVQIRLGTDSAVKLWLNDKEVFRMNVVREAIIDDNVLHVHLNTGLNTFLIKVCNRIGEWGYYFRITDDEGNGIPDLEYVSVKKDEEIS